MFLPLYLAELEKKRLSHLSGVAARPVSGVCTQSVPFSLRHGQHRLSLRPTKGQCLDPKVQLLPCAQSLHDVDSDVGRLRVQEISGHDVAVE